MSASMLGHLFQQKIQVEKRVGLDKFGKPMYGPPEDIMVRYDGGLKLSHQDQKSEMMYVYSVFTDADIEIGDRLTIDGLKLIAYEVSTTPDPTNLSQVLFREVYTMLKRGTSL